MAKDVDQIRSEAQEKLKKQFAKAVRTFGNHLGKTMYRMDAAVGVDPEDRGGLEMPETIELDEADLQVLTMVLTKIALKHGEYLGYDGSGGQSAATDIEIAETLVDMNPRIEEIGEHISEILEGDE